MAYLKIKRFREAEDDCTEALNLDDRYIKAYSRRAMARKELRKLKESIELTTDSGFALKLEPNNQEIKKQHAEVKSLYEKKVSGTLRSSLQEAQKGGRSEASVNGHAVHQVSNATQRTGVSASKKDNNEDNDGDYLLKKSVYVKELRDKGTGAGSKSDGQVGNDSPANANPSSNIESVQVTSPSALPQVFKNALSVPILIDIIKCVASFFIDVMDLAVKYLENLTKVPRFGVLIMCLSSTDMSDLLKMWDGVFCSASTPIEYAEILDTLRSKYCPKC